MVKRTVFMFFIISLLISSRTVYAKPKVLLIESYHSDNQWDIDLIEGLESILQDKVEIVTFQMDTKRLKKDKYLERADMAWDFYLKCNPDIVVLADDNALKYLGKRFLSTSTPVVYMGINNNPRKYIPISRNITGVLERPLYKRTIKYLKYLLYIGEGKVLILLDEGTTAKAFMESVFYNSDSMLISGVQTDIKLISSFSNWKRVVQDARDDGYKAIVIGLYHRVFDEHEHVASEEVLHWTSSNSPVPLFAFWDMSVGKGKAIGGMVLNGEEQGIAAGRIVLEILGGKPVEKIRPVIPEQGKFVFSRSELARWKIRLPYKIKEKSQFVE
ncbi:ABC transporter substrate-binding protein [Maridesulfovibrio hydrothermalis]|uniref:ABC-type sugar transport system, ATPase component n=1 Tax=Maridesulfovibrio hydrothermalis AM13 = DSM 14728 TaxID=1121451 RepID=L0RF03_9BACT|nr:ABC transporter substrate binding protein [Maridesulfovibrio hydrothermalis]CCO24780.1 ABC-type sugar transport system, ATPase component [Maridesulfovibrio hydrothermalis AM13 = DSM 14728]